VNNENNPININIKHYGKYIVVKNDQVYCKAIKEIIRIADVEIKEYEFARKKFTNKIDFLDLKVREAFPSRVSIVTLKCYYGYNLMGIRDNFINEKNTVKDCPRCGADEMWEHIVLCNANHYRRAKFVFNLEQKLLWLNNTVELEQITMIITDIRHYLI